MTERKIAEKVRKIITFFDTPHFLILAQTGSNDNYIHKVSENTSFTFVDVVDLKFKSWKFFRDTLYTECEKTLPLKLSEFNSEFSWRIPLNIIQFHENNLPYMFSGFTGIICKCLAKL